MPEAVELPGRKVRKGDKVRVLPPRGERRTPENDRLWRVTGFEQQAETRAAKLAALDDGDETTLSATEDLVVVAEFRDPIYPGLVSTGKVERGGDKPFHTVINAENFHALQTLLFTHRGKVDCIYIDPPYNTGAKDWKYNNDYVEGDDLYRHSKWLAFMERRLLVAKELLNPSHSVLIVAIDEKEYHRLGLVLEQVFPEGNLQAISTQVNPAVVARPGSFGRSDEYIFFVMLGSASPQAVPLPREWVSAKGRTHTGKIRWDMFMRSGTGASRSDRPTMFYPIYIDPSVPRIVEAGEALPPGVDQAPERPGLVPLLPIRQDGSQGRWTSQASTLLARVAEGRVRVNGDADKGYSVSVLKDGEWAKVLEGEYEVSGRNSDGSVIVEDRDPNGPVTAVPGSQWRISSHDSTQYGTRLLSQLLPGRKFPFPKSLYAVEDTLRFFLADKPEAVVLDFFVGSGTTAHAVMRLNQEDGGERKSIVVTNNEISHDESVRLTDGGYRPGDVEWEALGIFEHVTRPRLEACVTGHLPEGAAVSGSYKSYQQVIRKCGCCRKRKKGAPKEVRAQIDAECSGDVSEVELRDGIAIADGLEENVEFFRLTYEAPLRVSSHREFGAVAPLLWLRAGSGGRRIEHLSEGWDVADTYGVIADLDKSEDFLEAVTANERVRTAFIVTNEDRLFEATVAELPDHAEPVRLYESYLRNFEIEAGRSVR